ncbi:MAG: LCP family protein [Desulfitobacteriaceae bacterium]|nr:LCP family protein [Clostridia bacterium]MDD4345498.1 LCP family protein [Desulfitobacteriaceae bacterium]MDD4400643.1 LCP family protein [Desulfitobacteriaceae bacterium]
MWNTKKLKGFLFYPYRIILVTCVVLGIVVLVWGMFFFTTPGQQNTVVNNGKDRETGEAIESSQTKGISEDQESGESLPKKVGSLETIERTTILLVGTDWRPGEKSISNMDSLLIAQVDPQIAQISLLSIPRDTQVEIPGYGKCKINAAARLGEGLKTTEALLEKVCGQSIDGYVLSNFAGFKGIIDTMGGINLTVEKDMYYDTGESEDGVIDLKKGKQHLNGTQALQYVRFRQDALADISRTMRQQKVLKAMVEEFGQIKTLPKLPWLVSQIYKNVQTDLTLGQIWTLINIFADWNSIKLAAQTLPGNFLIEDGISYWQVDREETLRVCHEFFTKGKTAGLFSEKENI